MYGFLLPHNFPDEALVTKNITIKFSYRYKILHKCFFCAVEEYDSLLSITTEKTIYKAKT